MYVVRPAVTQIRRRAVWNVKGLDHRNIRFLDREQLGQRMCYDASGPSCPAPGSRHFNACDSWQKPYQVRARNWLRKAPCQLIFEVEPCYAASPYGSFTIDIVIDSSR